MTIVITALSSGGIVMAGESRCLISNGSDVSKGFENNKISHELHTDNEEKVFLLGGKYGLAYTGVSFSPSGWNIQNDINELDYMAKEGADINTLAQVFNERVKTEIEPGMKYSFFFCGYEKGKPKQVCYGDGRNQSNRVPQGWREDVPKFPNGCYEHGLSMAGKVDLIQDFVKDKHISWNTLPLKDAIECVELLMVMGTKFLRYFGGHQQVSGGDIDILVISPMYTGFAKHKTLGLLEVV